MDGFQPVNKEEDEDLELEMQGSAPPEGMEYDSDAQSMDGNSDDEFSNISSSKRQKAQNVFRRSYKACLNCRKRKIKCDLGDLSNPSKPPCARCRREGKQCVFVESKRGGVANVRAGKEKKRKLESPSPPIIVRSLLGVPQAHDDGPYVGQSQVQTPAVSSSAAHTPLSGGGLAGSPAHGSGRGAGHAAAQPHQPTPPSLHRHQTSPQNHQSTPNHVSHEPYRQPHTFPDFDPEYPGFQGQQQQPQHQPHPGMTHRSHSDVHMHQGMHQMAVNSMGHSPHGGVF